LFYCVGGVYCTSDISNPTPVSVVQGGDAVPQCGFENNGLSWHVYNDGGWAIIADRGDTIGDSTYSVSKNPPTGLHCIVSDVNMYRCVGNINGRIELFYLMLYFLGRCNYILGIFKVGKLFILVGSSKIMF